MGFENPASSSTKSLPISGSISTTPQHATQARNLTASLVNLPTTPNTPTGTATPTQSHVTLPLPTTSVDTTIDTSKPYISSALRYLSTPESQTSVLSGLSAWRERFSADSSFQESLKKIKALKNEDHMRELPRPRKPTLVRRNAVKRGPMDERVWLRRRERVSDEGEPLPKTRVVSGGEKGDRGDGSRGDEEGTEGERSTRARWDIQNRGPLSPLSPTSVLGNSFGSGGFWDSATEIERPASAATVIGTEASPSEAEVIDDDADGSPSSPYKPLDDGNRDIFTSLKKAIHDATLTHCATRLANPDLLAPDALIHPSLIKKSDEVAAVEEVLAQKAKALVSCPLPPTTDTPIDINEEIKPFLSTEATVIGDYSIASPAELENTAAWLSLDDKRRTIATKLDTQLSLLRANWARARSDNVLRSEIPLAARELAWAVKFLTDVLGSNELVIFNSSGEEEEEGSDDGYSYQNFLHNMRSQANLPAGEVSPPWPKEMEKLRPKIVPWAVITGDESEDGEEEGDEEEGGEEEEEEEESEAETVRTTILFGGGDEEAVEGSEDEVEEGEDEEESPKGEKRARRRAPAFGELESWAVEARRWKGENEGEEEGEIGVAL